MNICDQSQCTGCQACMHACPVNSISMMENEKGFFYPVIDQAICIDCGKCHTLCPAINPPMDFREPLKVYAGWTKNSTVRHYSTSGGAAYSLSKLIVEEGGVFFGCRWRIDHAEHSFADTVDELGQFQGSKYAYSIIGNSYLRVKDFLSQGKQVMFIGTGCQVAGLKSYLNREYNNLITVDVLCHGIPSQKAIRDRISGIEKENGHRVVDMRFRDKHEDQVHTFCKYTFENGESVSHAVQKDVFFRGFDSNYLLRPNCFTCQYAQSSRVSDITLADFWGYKPIDFQFINYRDGVSLLLSNTDKGEQIIQRVKDFVLEERDYSLAKKGNRNLNGPQIRPGKYEEFWQRYMSGETLDRLSYEYFPARTVPPVIKDGWKTYVRIAIGENNINKIRAFIQRNLRWVYGPVVDARRRQNKARIEEKKFVDFSRLQPGPKRIFYCGVTTHPNLGDLGQRYCITNWIRENYPEHELIMIESDVIVNPSITDRFFNHLQKIYGVDDRIVFQSGYCTQDRGGNHPLMHQLVCDYMPQARILMMPQTIFFKNEENRKRCAENHNKAKKMLFLARDFVSYDMAIKMFPDICVKAFPDIVTTLIGTLHFNNKHEGVCLCTRNDGEKLYSYQEISVLEQRFEKDGITVAQKDTQSMRSVNELVQNLKYYIESEIETYSHFEVTITDRYHGTIYSLCAGTPVVILKTTDHKVTTGADWFEGIYDDYVYVADNLDDAYNKAKMVIKKKLNHELKPYFRTEYYDKLKTLFEAI